MACEEFPRRDLHFREVRVRQESPEAAATRKTSAIAKKKNEVENPACYDACSPREISQQLYQDGKVDLAQRTNFQGSKLMGGVEHFLIVNPR